jgi:hypothetical protein
MFYKFDFWVLKFKSPLLKIKTQCIKLYIYFWTLQHSYKSFTTIFLDQHDIKITLHKHGWKH